MVEWAALKELWTVIASVGALGVPLAAYTRKQAVHAGKQDSRMDAQDKRIDYIEKRTAEDRDTVRDALARLDSKMDDQNKMLTEVAVKLSAGR